LSGGSRPFEIKILSGAPAGAQSKDLLNSPHMQATVALFERSFDAGFAIAQDQDLRERLSPRLHSACFGARDSAGCPALRAAKTEIIC
jgi:hypothetical protein